MIAVHIILSCEAFANNQIDVTLVAPKVIRDEYVVPGESIFSLYGIKNPNFRILELNTNLKETKKNSSSRYSIVFQKLLNISHFCIKNKKQINNSNTIIYSKCFISTIPFILFRKIKILDCKIVFETITPKNKLLHRVVFRNSDKIISHIKYCTEDILNFSEVKRSTIFEAPYFTQSTKISEITENKETLKSFYGFPNNKKSILYAGKTGKNILEVEYFIETAMLLPNLNFIIVGANESALKYYTNIIEKNKIFNLVIYPFQTLENYYKFVLASDILVAYYPSTDHNNYYLSPGKSGIYLASKNPCIFSDLPSLRSLFPDGTVFYTIPDKPLELAKTISFVIENPTLAEETAMKAYDFALSSTYNKFASAVINFIERD